MPTIPPGTRVIAETSDCCIRGVLTRPLADLDDVIHVRDTIGTLALRGWMFCARYDPAAGAAGTIYLYA